MFSKLKDIWGAGQAPGPMVRWIWLSVAVVILDQATKALAEFYLSYGYPVEVMPLLNFTLLYNTGAAFSMLADQSGWQRWFFVLMASIISIAIYRWLRHLPTEEKGTAVALALVLGGAVGNLIDRVSTGHVVDFIDVYWDRWHWPAFNIADSAITIGVVVLLYLSFFGARPKA
ncbi:MAG: signal peptidase II [Gammaproteobacteria bacterium]